MLQNNNILNHRYKVINLIGQGGTAQTYLANDNKTNEKVLLKVIDLGDISNWKILDLFKREIVVLKSMDHSYIPDYIDNFQTEINGKNKYILVQEHIEGKNLESIVDTAKEFSKLEIEGIFKKLLKILIYIHSLKPAVIHRDINPKNIILTESGNVYLIDFGAVGLIEKDTLAASKSNTFVGTMGYMAPEQLLGKSSPASDLYGLGMTIIYLLTGKKPYELDLNGAFSIFTKTMGVSKKMKLLLEAMILPDHKKRIASAKKALLFLEGKINHPGQKKSKKNQNIIYIDEINSVNKTITLPKKGVLRINFLVWGILYILIVLFSVAAYTNTFILELLPKFFMIPGYLLIFIGILFMTQKKKLNLINNKIILKTTYFGFINLTKELFIEEYKGVSTKIKGIKYSEKTFPVRIVGKNKELNLGPDYSKAQIELLTNVIEKHIGNNLII